MRSNLQIVRDNLRRVQDRIAAAAQSAGRRAADITLVGVSKYVDAPTTALLVQAGCSNLGESRPQQLWAKAEALSPLGVRWHLIGHLQSNKINKTIPCEPLLHGIDSCRTLASVNKAAEAHRVTARVLLEVNCSGDPEKHGVHPDRLPQDIEGLGSFRHVQVIGLMTLAARDGGAEVARKNFAQLRQLRDTHAHLAPVGTQLSELSMGMSGDFEQAIAEGSTIVRIGSALWQGLDL